MGVFDREIFFLLEVCKFYTSMDLSSILTHFKEMLLKIILNLKFGLEFIMFYPKRPLGML